MLASFFMVCRLVTVASLMCCTSHAQGQVAVAVNEMKAVFEKHPITQGIFPCQALNPADFDPIDYDPLFLNQIWESVRPDVNRVLHQRLGVSEGPTLLFQVTAAASSTGLDGNAYVSKRCRLVFVVSNDDTRRVLKDAMSLPDECFRKAKIIKRTLLISSGDLKYTSLREIGMHMSSFANSDSIVRQHQFQPMAPIYLEDKVQLVTNWKHIRRRSGYDEYWRLFFQVKKDGDDQVVVSARAQFGRNLPNAPLSRLQYRGSDEDPPREFQDFVGGETASKIEVDWLPTDGMEGGFYSAAQVSPIGRQLEELLANFSQSLRN